MYPKIIRTKSRGKTYEYVYLCESIWKNGRSNCRTILSLGRKDLIAPHLDRIYELCKGRRPASPMVEIEVEGKGTKRGVCLNGRDGRKVLAALGVKPVVPKVPAEGDPTVH